MVAGWKANYLLVLTSAQVRSRSPGERAGIVRGRQRGTARMQARGSKQL